jgi:tetratricopeptide (TPR) repeat protein
MIRFCFLFLLTGILSLSAFAQKITYTQWKEETATDTRLTPKYGGIEKSEAQKSADSILIKTALADKTPREASDYFVQKGFDYLSQGDPKTAMYRFNQAWLIDPKNENVYWGFGGVYFSFGDHERALGQYTEGLVINPKSAKIMVDMATISLSRYSTNKDLNELTPAITMLNRAYEIEPTNQSLLFKLSICYFFKEDCINALKYYEECMKLGGKTIPESYKAALKTKCNP